MWYQNSVFYEIYIPSFCDGNGDGIGDFKGLLSKLPYLKELGIKGLWLTPFYPSPRVDNGYDISDYCSVDASFGTIEEFKELLDKAHAYGIRIIIDMVLNHTSTMHPWFLDSKANKNSPYRDYYIWKKEIPNNWESFFSGSAWEYDEQTEEYYYHAFAKEQACLNWSNELVKEEMFRVLSFWLDLGVDGFRFDVINFLKTDPDFNKNNPIENQEITHKYDKNQDGILPIIEEIKAYVSKYKDKFLLGEIGEDALEDMLPYVGSDKLDACFNFNIGSISEFNIETIYNELQKIEKANILPTLFFTTHDTRRHFSRLCKENTSFAKVLILMVLTLKGIPFLYQGEEFPMKDFCPQNLEEMQDIQGIIKYNNAIENGKSKEEAFSIAYEGTRDFSRSLLSWDENFIIDEGVYQFYKKAIALRNASKALQYGNYDYLQLDDGVLCYGRTSEQESYKIYLNFSDKYYPLSVSGDVILSTEEFKGGLEPYQGVVFLGV